MSEPDPWGDRILAILIVVPFLLGIALGIVVESRFGT